MQPFLPGDEHLPRLPESLVHILQMVVKCIKNGLYLPYEDTGIPKKIAGAQEGDRQFEVGLFREGLHLEDARCCFAVGELDITITGIGPGR